MRVSRSKETQKSRVVYHALENHVIAYPDSEILINQLGVHPKVFPVITREHLAIATTRVQQSSSGQCPDYRNAARR